MAMVPLLLLWAGAIPASQAPRPWTPPPTTLPPEFIRTVSFLQRHGLADPRGGELRKARIVAKHLGEPPPTEEVYGWVLPSTPGRPRQLVTLSGVAYPVVSPGDPATLDEALGPKGMGPSLDGPFLGFRTHRSLVISVLLVHGDVERAERLYRPPRGDEEFVSTAGSFLTELWKQTVWAHARGDAELALRTATLLQRYRDDYEREAIRQKGEAYFARQQNEPPPDGRRVLAFPFLAPVDDLVADSARRLQGENRRPNLEALRALPAEVRISRLIEALDQVSRYGYSEPQDLDLSDDPIVRALIQEGHAAVDPLFEAVDRDRRLTRAFTYREPGQEIWHLIPVRAAAIEAIQGILGVHEFRTDRPFPMPVDDLQRLWQRTREARPAERWLAILQDSSAGRVRWTAAARLLFASPGVVIKPGSMRGVRRESGTPPPPASYTELSEGGRAELIVALANRTLDLARSATTHPTSGMQSATEALVLGRYLASLDPPHGRENIVYAIDAAMALHANGGGRSSDLARHIGGTVAAIARDANDPLVDRYLAWLPSVEPHNGWQSSRAFQPLVTLRRSPKGQEAARKLFAGADSPWNLKRLLREKGFGSAESYLVSPLIQLDVVHEALVSLLNDRSRYGEIRRHPDTRMLWTYIDGRESGGYAADGEDPYLPEPGSAREYRVRDAVMRGMISLHGVKFQVYWPTDVKDRLIDEFLGRVRDRSYVLGKLPDHVRWDWFAADQ